MFTAHLVTHNGRPAAAFIDPQRALTAAAQLPQAFTQAVHFTSLEARRDFVVAYTPNPFATQEAAA